MGRRDGGAGLRPPRCERRARKTNYILLGAAVLAGLVFCVFGGGLNGGAAALTAVLCMGSPLSSTLIAGFASLRLQQTAAASGAVIPGWAAIEELGGVDTVQADADELFTPDSAMLEDIRIFKGGRIDRAILYSASVLSKCCNTLSGLFRQIMRTAPTSLPGQGPGSPSRPRFLCMVRQQPHPHRYPCVHGKRRSTPARRGI